MVNYVQLTFTDGSTWEDTQSSVYLALKDNSVRFLSLNYDAENPYAFSVSIGDSIILIDTTNNELTPVLKQIQNITTTKTIFTGWEIGVERRHMFLTQTSNNTSYVAIEHNVACVDDVSFCSRTQCGKSLYCTRGNGQPCLSMLCNCRGYCFGKV